MHLVVINCSPRMQSKSNTHLILESFIKGYTANGNTVELHNLSKRSSWKDIQKAFDVSSHILMAVPLFVECIPGLMMEFLESLIPKQTDQDGVQTTISFILQGGFSEACQLRCCELYLQILPAHLGCAYGGTLIKGGMFVTRLMKGDSQARMTGPFEEMGSAFASDHCFRKDKSDRFAGAEYASKQTILLFKILGPVQKLFFEQFFKKLGCTGKLTARPYSRYLYK